MTEASEAECDGLAERLFGAMLGAMDLVSIYLGDRLGWCAALAEVESMTSVALAEATGTNERYTREWLEQQAVAGLLQADNGEADATTRQCQLSPGYAEVLTDPESLASMVPAARFLAGIFGGCPSC